VQSGLGIPIVIAKPLYSRHGLYISVVGKFSGEIRNMKFTTRTKFDSLIEALKSPTDCRTLNLLFVKENLKHLGQSFRKLENLRELFIQGDVGVFYDEEFDLPEEIGQLTKIEKLTLLNLPIKDFPRWTLNLKRLKYLMIRGTDLQILPGSIKQLSELTTLRIENCPLTALPTDLKEMNKLKNLGLSDTKLTIINQETLPTSLRKINLAGTQLFDTDIKITGRHLKSENV
jgi:Leucine-rich repeat (LRR) protein